MQKLIFLRKLVITHTTRAVHNNFPQNLTVFYSFNMFDLPSELSGNFIHTVYRLRADRGLYFTKKPSGESAATVKPSPGHLSRFFISLAASYPAEYRVKCQVNRDGQKNMT